MTRIFAVDPSDTGGTWAYIEALHTGQYRPLRHGTIRSQNLSKTRKELKDLLKELQPDITAVETNAGYLSRKRLQRTRNIENLDIQDLMDSAFWSGFFVACMPRPAETVCIPANNKPKKPSWRKLLTGKMHADDDTILATLNLLLEGGVPILSKKADGSVHAYRLNVHVRDAIGLGIVADSITKKAA